MDILWGVSSLLLLVSALLIGNAVAAVLHAPSPYVVPLGISALAVIITLLMITLDAQLDVAQIAVTILLLATLHWRSSLYSNRRSLLEGALVALVIWLIIVAPAIVGGSQFFSFRGNWWDHFNYLAGVESVSIYRASTIRHLTDGLAAADPIALYGNPAVRTRPAAVLIAAVFRFPRVDIFAYAYGYLAMLLALFGAFVAQALSFMFRAPERRVWCYAIAIGVAVGFWGQFLIDTSVWSHIAVLPILSALVFRTLSPSALNGEAKEQGELRSHLVTFVLYAAGFVTYPEATSVLAVLLTLTLLVVSRPLTRCLQHGATFGSAVIVASVVDYSGSLAFFFSQLSFGVSNPTGSGSWFLYFFQPYFGYNFTDRFAAQIVSMKALAQQAGPFALFRSVLASNPTSILLPLNVVPILLGYYAIVAGLATQSILLSVSVSAALTVLFIVCLVRSGTLDHATLLRPICIFTLWFAVLLVLFLVLGKIWELGKAFTFVMPLITPLLFALVLEAGRPQTRLRRLGAGLTLLFVASSGYFALSRVVLASRAAGIGHPSPFPSILHVDDKALFRYELPDIERCRSVEIAETHPNRSLYLLLGARQHTTAWFATPFTYYGAGKTYLPSVGRAAECRIAFAESAGDKGVSWPRLTAISPATQDQETSK